jgi:hypothetical protein
MDASAIHYSLLLFLQINADIHSIFHSSITRPASDSSRMDRQPLLIGSKLRRMSTKQRYHGRQRSTSIDSACRATPLVAPQLPHSPDPGTITDWIVDETVAATSPVITQELEQGFNRLVNTFRTLPMQTTMMSYENDRKRSDKQ